MKCNINIYISLNNIHIGNEQICHTIDENEKILVK